MKHPYNIFQTFQMLSTSLCAALKLTSTKTSNATPFNFWSQHVKWLLALQFCATVNSDKKKGRWPTPWFYLLCEIQQSWLLRRASDEQFTLKFTERIEERQGKLSVSFTLIHRVFSLSRFPTCSESGSAVSSSREAIWQWGGVGHLKVGLRHRQTYIGTFRESSLH